MSCSSSDCGKSNKLLILSPVQQLSSSPDEAIEEVETEKNTDVFPWLSQYQSLCNTVLLQRTSNSLIKIIKFFIRNVSLERENLSSIRAPKVKNLINEALLLFMYIHRFQQNQEQNRAIYLSLMSDLLAMYIDMELFIWTNKEQSNKISNNIISYLHVYLENSPEHLLNTIMKVESISETYYQILDPILVKIFKSIPAHPDSESMYVRYFLVYRLWMKIHNNKVVKEQIKTNALASLASPPQNISNFIIEHVLPKPCTSESISSNFYLSQPFDEKTACNSFIKYSNKFMETLDDGELEILTNHRLYWQLQPG